MVRFACSSNRQLQNLLPKKTRLKKKLEILKFSLRPRQAKKCKLIKVQQTTVMILLNFMTPPMHNAAIEALGVDYVYLPIPVKLLIWQLQLLVLIGLSWL
jgi:hypothetical protein